jgi:hypothetical protein
MRKPRLVAQLEKRARQARFELLVQLLSPLTRPVRILDVGGDIGFWETCDHARLGEIQVTLLNLYVPDHSRPNFCFQIGDARSMPDFTSDDFDVVMSNSVIGHVGSWCDQERMAGEIKRIGKRYFVQTPNHYFPVDWDTLVPLFHFLPLKVRARLLNLLPIASIGRIRSYASAVEWASGVRNLTYRELQHLFPQAFIAREKVAGFTKSFMVYKGLILPDRAESTVNSLLTCR